jgi:hypothetical protein
MTTSPTPSRLARLSLILGIAGWAVWCLYFIIFSVFISGGFDFGSALNTETAGYALALGGPLVASVFTILFTVASVIVGIQALRKGDPQRGMAFAGLAMSLLCLVPYLLLVIWLVVSGIQNGGF